MYLHIHHVLYNYNHNNSSQNKNKMYIYIFFHVHILTWVVACYIFTNLLFSSRMVLLKGVQLGAKVRISVVSE